METNREVSFILWWLFLVACVGVILLIFELLRKKTRIKMLRYVGYLTASMVSIYMSKPMWKTQIQIIEFRDEASEYRSIVSASMDSSQIDAIQTHNNQVKELQAKAEEHPIIYWIRSGDIGQYEEFIVQLPS